MNITFEGITFMKIFNGVAKTNSISSIRFKLFLKFDNKNFIMQFDICLLCKRWAYNYILISILENHKFVENNIDAMTSKI